MLLRTIIFMIIKLSIAWIIFVKVLPNYEIFFNKKRFKPAWVALYVFATVSMVSGYVDMYSALEQIADGIFYRL